MKLKKKISNIIKKIPNLKSLINKYTDKDFLHENIRVVILGILGIIFLIAIFTYFCISKNLSKIEEEKIKTESIEYSNYLEDIKDIKKNNLDKYIIYTLDYSKYVNEQNKMTSKEIKDFLETNLNKKVEEKDIKDFGVNNNMLDKNITYNSIEDSYIMNDTEIDRKSLENIPITYYKIKKIRKINKKKYIIKYDKYIIDNPYELINFYLERNRKIIEKDNKESVDEIDLTLIRNYLTTGNIKDIKHFLNMNDKELSSYSKVKGHAKVTYLVNDQNDFVIYKIR